MEENEDVVTWDTGLKYECNYLFGEPVVVNFHKREDGLWSGYTKTRCGDPLPLTRSAFSMLLMVSPTRMSQEDWNALTEGDIFREFLYDPYATRPDNA